KILTRRKTGSERTRRKAGAERTRRKKHKQNDCFPQKDSHGLSPSVFSEEKSLTIRWMIVSQSDALLTDSELPICFIFFKVKNVVFSDENGVFLHLSAQRCI
ncbi:MAG: hypothetical protein SPE13_07870, partial [Alloprevotella sp.]|nr:hypothetical protein [Alloprevotella sp.]